MKLAPSILSADFSNLLADVKKIETGGADYIHVDVMDGHFVPNISFGAPVMKCLNGKTTVPYDVHLMIENPDLYIDDFVTPQTEYITVHQEASRHLHRTIQKIKSHGIKAGVAINPATPVSTLSCVFEDADLILIMSVNPGFGGQKFIPYTLEKIKKLRGMLNEAGLTTDIEVDGGVNAANVREVLDAGANVIVAGSAVFKNDAAANTKEFLKIFEEYSAR